MPRIMASIGHHGGMNRDSAVSHERSWTLLTNHGRLLLLIAQDTTLRLRDLAEAAGISERSAQMIVADLEHAGYIVKERAGRRNIYRINRARPFRHPAESGHTVGELIDLFAPEPRPRRVRA